MKIRILSISFLSLLLLSCSGDFLSVEENSANIPSSTAPTITAFLCPQDSIHTVRLYYTSPVVGKNNLQEWTNNVGKSVVTLSDENQTVTLKSEENSSSVFKVKSKDFKVVAGKSYTLKVITYDGQKAEATCTIPLNRIDIKTVDTKAVNAPNFPEPKYLITWMDIPNEQNYYAVYMVAEQINFTTGERRIDYDEGENSILDIGYEGKRLSTKKSFLLRKRQNAGSGFVYISEIQLLNTDINFYKYQKDLEIQRISADNPLVEPVNIYSNIKEGFGVFAGYTRASGYF